MYVFPSAVFGSSLRNVTILFRAQISLWHFSNLTGLGGAPPTNTSDYILDVTYYDFSVVHPDFVGDGSATYRRPSLVASPYGGWPAASATPTLDSFSDWYRVRPGVNIAVQKQLVLTYDPPGRYHR